MNSNDKKTLNLGDSPSEQSAVDASHSNLFNSPRAYLPTDDVHKTTVVLSGELCRKLKTCHGSPGTLVRTISILTAKLATALEQYGLDLTQYDPSTYERLVAGCAIVFPGGAMPVSTGDTGTNTTPPYGTPVTITHPTPGQTAPSNDATGTRSVSTTRSRKPAKRSNAA